MTPAFTDVNILLYRVSVTDMRYVERKHVSWNCFTKSLLQIQGVRRLLTFITCTTRPETHCVQKLLKTSPQREHKIIVTPSAANPSPEFLLYLCVRASPGWPLGAEEQGVECHIYRCLLLALADISQIFHLQEREKEKEKYTFCFLRERNAWWDAHFQCILIIYWRNLLKDTLKSYQRTTEVMRQGIFYQNK